MGARALRSAWPITTRRSERPRARAACHVVGAQLLDHRGPLEAAPDGHVDQREREHRQHQVLEVVEREELALVAERVALAGVEDRLAVAAEPAPEGHREHDQRPPRRRAGPRCAGAAAPEPGEPDQDQDRAEREGHDRPAVVAHPDRAELQQHAGQEGRASRSRGRRSPVMVRSVARVGRVADSTPRADGQDRRDDQRQEHQLERRGDRRRGSARSRPRPGWWC